MSNEDYVQVKLLKGIAEYLHCAVAKHRKTIHGKKKHDFNFKSKVIRKAGFNGTLYIYKWLQDHKAYSTWSMVVGVNGATAYVQPRNKCHNLEQVKTIELASPDSFDQIAAVLIKHLDWRG
jgi:hypothetical protein